MYIEIRIKDDDDNVVVKTKAELTGETQTYAGITTPNEQQATDEFERALRQYQSWLRKQETLKAKEETLCQCPCECSCSEIK